MASSYQAPAILLKGIRKNIKSTMVAGSWIHNYKVFEVVNEIRWVLLVRMMCNNKTDTSNEFIIINESLQFLIFLVKKVCNLSTLLRKLN